MLIKHKLQEIHFKIVYFGPSMSGKTTNLEKIHSKIQPDLRSSMISIKTLEDRTLYFDFTQLSMKKINGLTPRFDIYTIPGQVQYKATRKIILQGVDGIVFVADSQISRIKDNIESYRDLKTILREMNISEHDCPLVIQSNKQDLENTLPPDILKKNLIGSDHISNYSAIAINGIGVFETLKDIIVQLGKKLVTL